MTKKNLQESCDLLLTMTLPMLDDVVVDAQPERMNARVGVNRTAPMEPLSSSYAPSVKSKMF